MHNPWPKPSIGSAMPSLITFLSLLFILLLHYHPLQTLSEKCNPNDKKALLKIKAALNNPYALASWDPATDCCDWYVVHCDFTTHRITQLSLFADPSLSGHIPAAVSGLPHLQLLMFHKLNLTGTIPKSITKLRNLQILDLSWNHLSGPIPKFLNQIRTLTLLDLSFNDFTGSIPPGLSELPNLDTLHLDRNRLTGTIPDSLGRFSKKVPSLYLSHNMLTGEVPRSLGGLNFSSLDFSRNRLQGDASFLFGADKTLQIVDLSRNVLEFDVSKVVFPDSLTWLDLNHNRITGRLPAGLTKLNLQNLNVSYNRLCGKIPTGGELQRMDVTSYFHNKCLCGNPLPACK